MCCIESSSLVAAGFGTIILSDRLPGFIGPFPPPLLIRLYAISLYILLKIPKKSILFSTFILEKCSQFLYRLFCLLLVECYKYFFQE